MPFLGDVAGHDEPQCGERVVGEESPPVVRIQGGGQRDAQPGLGGAERSVHPFEALQCRRPVRGPAQQHVPEPHRRHGALREVVQPRGVEQVEDVGARARAPVADPRLGVPRSILHLALDHPAVERHGGRADPAPHAVERVAVAAVLPVGEQLRDAARCQMRSRLTHERLDEGVPHHPAVAVLVRGHARGARGDDERRIRDDVVEGLPRHRLEQAAQPELDALDAVEACVERRELEGMLGDVGRHDVVGMPGGVERLDPAPRAHIECARHRALEHEAAQGERCAADTEHVVLGQRVAECELAEVRDDPPLARAPCIHEAVGAEVDGGYDRAVRDVHQPEFARALQPQRGQRGGRLRRRHRAPEHEKRGQRIDGARRAHCATGGQRPLGRHPLIAVQRLRGGLPPQLLQCVDGEPGRPEVRP